MQGRDRTALLVVVDLLARSRLEEAAAAEGVTTRATRRLGDPPAGGDAPDLVVCDLDLPGALEDLARWRAAHPELRVVGFLSHVETERWRAAEGLGVEVITRGATAKRGREIFAF